MFTMVIKLKILFMCNVMLYGSVPPFCRKIGVLIVSNDDMNYYITLLINCTDYWGVSL